MCVGPDQPCPSALHSMAVVVAVVVVVGGGMSPLATRLLHPLPVCLLHPLPVCLLHPLPVCLRRPQVIDGMQELGGLAESLRGVLTSSSDPVSVASSVGALMTKNLGVRLRLYGA